MEIMINFSNGVVELLCLYSKVHNLYIAVTYRQPDDKVGNHRSTEIEFQQAMEKLKKSLQSLPDPTPNIFFCGDFNLPHVSWPDGSSLQGSSISERSMLESLIQLQNEHFMNQYITTPPHVGGGLLDLVFCNNTALIHSYETIQPLRSTSDHFVMEVSTRLLSNAADEEEELIRNENLFEQELLWEFRNAFGKLDNT